MATIVLMVADAAALTSGDTTLRDRLQNTHGHTVLLRSDEAAEEAGGSYDGFVIGESVASGLAGTKYRDAAVPGIVMEGALWDEHLLGAFSTSTAQTQWNMQSVPPLNAGLTGLTTVYSSSQSQHWSLISAMGAGVQVVAQHATDSTRGTVFVYESGATTVTGTAPARRVALGILDTAIGAMTTDGLAVLDAVLDWAFPSLPAGPLTPSPSRRHRTLLAR